MVNRGDRPGGRDVLDVVDVVVTSLEPAVGSHRWGERAGTLNWSCRRTLAHVVDCLVWYAAHLARRTSGDVEVPEMDRNATAPVLLDALRSGGALLAAVVERADPTDRGWHPFGIADRSGFAAMGCDEALIHGSDIAAGLGVALDPAPPSVLCERVLRRLFPWAPEGVDPWDALLWANGRQPLGDRPSDHRWLWHCAPLVEWDGEVRRMS